MRFSEVSTFECLWNYLEIELYFPTVWMALYFHADNRPCPRGYLRKHPRRAEKSRKYSEETKTHFPAKKMQKRRNITVNVNLLKVTRIHVIVELAILRYGGVVNE